DSITDGVLEITDPVHTWFRSLNALDSELSEFRRRQFRDVRADRGVENDVDSFKSFQSIDHNIVGTGVLLVLVADAAALTLSPVEPISCILHRRIDDENLGAHATTVRIRHEGWRTATILTAAAREFNRERSHGVLDGSRANFPDLVARMTDQRPVGEYSDCPLLLHAIGIARYPNYKKH